MRRPSVGGLSLARACVLILLVLGSPARAQTTVIPLTGVNPAVPPLANTDTTWWCQFSTTVPLSGCDSNPAHPLVRVTAGQIGQFVIGKISSMGPPITYVPSTGQIGLNFDSTLSVVGGQLHVNATGVVPNSSLVSGNGSVLGSVAVGSNLTLVGSFPNQTLNATSSGGGSGGCSGYQTVSLTGSAFIPNISTTPCLTLQLVHGACPCTLNNMAGLTPGQSGVIHVINSSSGSEQLVLSGTQYAITQTPPFTSDPISKTDWVYFVTADSLIQIPQALLPPTISSTAPNLLSGGDSMSSGWVALASTLTSGATCTSPIGGVNTCALLKEDTSNAVHRVNQSATLSTGTNTVSVFAKISSGTRYIEMRMADGPFSNVASETFDPVTCSDNPAVAPGTGPQAAVGAAVITAHGTIGRPNGFCEGWMQANLGGATPTITSVELSTVGGDFYTGDGVSGNLLWRPAARAGAQSPP